MDKLEQMLEHQQRLNDIIRSSELITDAVWVSVITQACVPATMEIPGYPVGKNRRNGKWSTT